MPTPTEEVTIDAQKRRLFLPARPGLEFRLAVRLGHVTDRRPERGGERWSSFALLRRRRFGALFAAGSISALGDPLTRVAVLTTVYSLRRNALDLGLAFTVQALAGILAGAFAGRINDRLDRRRLIVAGDFFRAGLLLAAPLVVVASPTGLFGIIALLGGLEVLVGSARVAGLPQVVPAAAVSRAGGLIASAANLGGLLGFPLAAALLIPLHGPGGLFVLDGLTFAAAAALTLAAGSLGGGSAAARGRRFGALGTALSVAPARPALFLAGFAALFIAASQPALFALSYQLVPAQGAQAYGFLELVLGAGAMAGALLTARYGTGGSAGGGGLLTMGLFSVGIALSPALWPAAACLLLASLGNPVYTVANSSFLLTCADDSRRGSLMAARSTLISCAVVLGSGLGGLLLSAIGGRGTYAVIGAGLLMAAVLSLAARDAATVPESPGQRSPA